jgi:branched-subunit amino acid aminotransferase/4-amino-4-deoxychorismate lyase
MSKIAKISTGDSVRLEPSDGGFAYGEGLFETLKLHDGKLFLWKDHWARLRASAESLGFGHLPDEAATLGVLRDLLREEKRTEGIVKLSLVRQTEGTVLYLYCRQSLGVMPEQVHLQLESKSRINPHSLLAGHKSHNYMEAMTLWRRAQAEGFYDSLRLDTGGALAETCLSNLFFLKDKLLCTPSKESGILPGVVRSRVLEVARNHNIKTEEGCYFPEDLQSADAVFLTNSIAGVVPVVSIKGSFQSDGQVHPLTKELHERFASLEEGAFIKI